MNLVHIQATLVRSRKTIFVHGFNLLENCSLNFHISPATER